MEAIVMLSESVPRRAHRQSNSQTEGQCYLHGAVSLGLWASFAPRGKVSEIRETDTVRAPTLPPLDLQIKMHGISIGQRRHARATQSWGGYR